MNFTPKLAGHTRSVQTIFGIPTPPPRITHEASLIQWILPFFNVNPNEKNPKSSAPRTNTKPPHHNHKTLNRDLRNQTHHNKPIPCTYVTLNYFMKGTPREWRMNENMMNKCVHESVDCECIFNTGEIGRMESE